MYFGIHIVQYTTQALAAACVYLHNLGSKIPNMRPCTVRLAISFMYTLRSATYLEASIPINSIASVTKTF
jgi:hypothetical protein